MKELAYLNKFFVRYKWHLLAGIVFVALSNYFRILQPQIIRESIDWVVESVQMHRHARGFELQNELYKNLGSTLFYFGALVILMAIIMGIFMYFMRQTIIVMSRLIEYDMRKEIFAHYEKLDQGFYKRNNTGDLMSRITEDVSKVRMYVGPALLYGINLVTLFVFVISSMLSVNVELTLWSLLPLPFLSLSIYYISSLIHTRSELIQQQLARLNSLSQEVYSGIRVVKSYVQQGALGDYFEEESEHFKEKSMDLAKINALFFPAMLLLIGISTIVTVYVGGLLAVKGTVSPGNIAEFVIYVNMLTWPVTSIGWIASLIQQASASQKRINQFLSQEPSISNPTEQHTPIKGNIRFQNVGFTYPDSGTRALSEVTFELKQGEKLAIVGKTGAGKTTIADLLVRLYDANTGKILLDGKDIRSHNLEDLRQKIGYVTQDMFLFSDTIAANIAFSQKNISRKEIEQYARYAAVYDDIMSLSNGFDTMVGERGVTLSGGQKQRITLARALVKQPEIIILDDSLSAVDSATEQQITNHLRTTLADKTTIIITHRIFNQFEFDKIIVLENGRIVEQGSHSELVQSGGFYATLFEKQQLEETKI